MSLDLSEIVNIIARNQEKAWKVLPQRCLAERTFLWLGKSGWLNKDYGIRTVLAEARKNISHIRILVKMLGMQLFYV